MEKDEYTFYAATGKDGITCYFRVTKELEVMLFDAMVDRGYKIWQIAPWKWKAQTLDRHDEKDEMGLCYDIEFETDINNFMLIIED